MPGCILLQEDIIVDTLSGDFAGGMAVTLSPASPHSDTVSVDDDLIGKADLSETLTPHTRRAHGACTQGLHTGLAKWGR